MSTSSITNVTLPSPKEKFAPPGWRLLNPQCDPGIGGSTVVTMAGTTIGVLSGLNVVRMEELQRFPLVHMLLLLIKWPLIVSPKNIVLLSPSTICDIFNRLP